MEADEKFAQHHKELINDFKERLKSARQSPQDALSGLLEFLQSELLPHAKAEEEELYAAVDEKTRNSLSTATMRKDHRELENRIGELVDLQGGDVDRIQRKLNEFSAILMNHFHKEETILVPFLDEKLNNDDFETLLNDVHESESRLREKGN